MSDVAHVKQLEEKVESTSTSVGEADLPWFLRSSALSLYGSMFPWLIGIVVILMFKKQITRLLSVTAEKIHSMSKFKNGDNEMIFEAKDQEDASKEKLRIIETEAQAGAEKPSRTKEQIVELEKEMVDRYCRKELSKYSCRKAVFVKPPNKRGRQFMADAFAENEREKILVIAMYYAPSLIKNRMPQFEKAIDALSENDDFSIRGVILTSSQIKKDFLSRYPNYLTYEDIEIVAYDPLEIEAEAEAEAPRPRKKAS